MLQSTIKTAKRIKSMLEKNVENHPFLLRELFKNLPHAPYTL